MDNGKTSPLLYVITTLLVVNLAAMCWLISKVSNSPVATTDSLPIEPLPSYFTKEVLNQIYKDFRQAYNSRDIDAFWAIFSDLARSQMDKMNVEKTYQQLWDYFGAVNEGTFSHYEYEGRKGNLKAYVLYYIVSFSGESKFGDRGELTITITDDGREYGILSAYLQAKTQ